MIVEVTIIIQTIVLTTEVVLIAEVTTKVTREVEKGPVNSRDKIRMFLLLHLLIMIRKIIARKAFEPLTGANKPD